MSKHRRSFTPEEVVEILRKHGTIVTVEKAKIILEGLQKWAKLCLEQFFNL